MKITLSPANKFVFMTLLVLVCLLVIHFFGVPILQSLKFSNIHPVLHLLIDGLFLIIVFILYTYSKAHRPLVPGKSSWETNNYSDDLFIETTPEGIVKFLTLVAKISIFFFLLYLVSRLTVTIYLKTLPEIFNGTYIYDRFEVMVMLMPAVILFFLLLYIYVKITDYFSNIKKGTRKNT